MSGSFPVLSAILGSLGLWGFLAFGGAIIAAVGLLLWRVRASGARHEREKRERERQRARDISQRIDDKVAGLDMTTAKEELRRWSR